MPPKKNKKEKTQDSEEGKNAVLAMFQQLDQEKINALSNRVDEAVAEKLELQRTLDKTTKDTHEFVNYFQGELEKKDVLLVKQRGELKEAEAKLDETVTHLTDKFEAQLATQAEERRRTEKGLRSRLRIVEEELQKLDEFRESKRVMEARIAELEAAADATARAHKIEVADIERHFLTDKAKVKAKYDAAMATMREGLVEELEETRDEETKRVIAENLRLKDELRFQKEVTEELNGSTRTVSGANKKLLLELALFEEKEYEYARQGKAKSREIAATQEKVAGLERRVAELSRRLAGEKQSRADHHAKAMGEANEDAAQLRQVLMLKNRELNMIRTHAATILEQRTDVEQFFVEALEECKKAVAQERQQKYRESLAEYRSAVREATFGGPSTGGGGGGGGSPKVRTRQSEHQASALSAASSSLDPSSSAASSAASLAPSAGGGGGIASNPPVFPRIRAVAAQRGPLNGGKVLAKSVLAVDGGRASTSLPLGLSAPPTDKVELGDLSWGDRERVLRVLFAKINAVQGSVARMPEHPLKPGT